MIDVKDILKRKNKPNITNNKQEQKILRSMHAVRKKFDPKTVELIYDLKTVKLEVTIHA